MDIDIYLYIYIWRLESWNRGTPVTIHYSWIFPEINHPALGVPPFMENPISSQAPCLSLPWKLAVPYHHSEAATPCEAMPSTPLFQATTNAHFSMWMWRLLAQEISKNLGHPFPSLASDLALSLLETQGCRMPIIDPIIPSRRDKHLESLEIRRAKMSLTYPFHCETTCQHLHDSWSGSCMVMSPPLRTMGKNPGAWSGKPLR